MRNLKRLATSLVALVLVIAFSSCEKQATSDTQDVSFNVKNVTDLLSKKAVGPQDDRIPTCTDADPAYVIATIDGEDYKLNVLSGLNDGTETQVVKLMAGTYSLDGFMVYDANDMLIWAAPTAGSYYAELWGLNGVGLNTETEVQTTFDVVAFTKSSIDVDVLCWEEYSYKDFGFNWFDFQEVTIKTMCFFGDICPGVDVVDYVAGFTVDIYYGDVLLNTGNTADLTEAGPLCVEYPEFGDLVDETYSVTITLTNAPYELVGTGQLNADTGLFTWSETENNMIDINGEEDTDGIFDFLLYWGDNCNYDGNAGVNAIQNMGDPR